MLKKSFIILFLLTINYYVLYAVEGGYSNYIPGLYGEREVALPPEQGFAIRNDVYYYQAHGTRNNIEVINNTTVNTHINEYTNSRQNLTSLIYTFNKIDDYFTLSIGLQNTLSDTFNRNISINPIDTARATDQASGFSDLAIIPFALYWQQTIFYNLANSLTLSVTVPTSSYNKNKVSNLSANYWSFDLSYAMTYLNQFYNIELSLVPGVIYNTKNKSTKYHSGTEIYLEYMINKSLTQDIAVGLHGFITEQLTSDQTSDINFDGKKTKVRGLGPALMINNIFDTNISIIAKWLHEFYAINRTQNGDNILVSFFFTI